MWRGDALADVAGEPFAAAEVRRLEELWLGATESAIDADLAAGRHAQVLPELEALVAAHPLQERLHAQRMLALYRSGRQADALAAYRAAREVLVEQIGVEPGPELRRLHEAMLAQDPKLDQPAGAPTPTVRPSRGPRRRVLAVVGALLVVCGLAVFAVTRLTESDGLARIDENAVGVIDPDSGRITTQSTVGRGPSAIAAGGGSVWVANRLDGTVTRLGGERDPIIIPVGDRPTALAFAAGSLWVVDAEERSVARVDPATNRVEDTIEAGNAPSGVAAGFGALWVTSEVDRTLARIDPRTAARTEIDLGANPTAVATGAGAVWVTSEEGGVVFRIEPRLRVVTDTIGVGHGPVAVAVGEGAVWVVNRQDANVPPHRPGDEPGHGRRAGRARPERDRGRRRRGVGDERQRGRGDTNRSRHAAARGDDQDPEPPERDRGRRRLGVDVGTRGSGRPSWRDVASRVASVRYRARRSGRRPLAHARDHARL